MEASKRLRVLICGDRNWKDSDAIIERMEELPMNSIIIHGNARGADKMAGTYARLLNASDLYEFSLEVYPAQWDRFGKAAGPIRNQEMLNTGIDLVLAFHDDIWKSKGTFDMVDRAYKADIPVELNGEQWYTREEFFSLKVLNKR